MELTEVGPRFELKCEFGALFMAGEGHKMRGLFVHGITSLSPDPSIHDSPWHAGAGGHSRRRMALAPLYQHCPQEGLPERRVSCELLASQDADLDSWGKNWSQTDLLILSGNWKDLNKPSVIMLPNCLYLVTVGLLSLRPSAKDEAPGVSMG